jgi:hypothetical protein
MGPALLVRPRSCGNPGPVPHYQPMQRSTPDHGEWTDERIDRLARALLPVVFADRAPAPYPAAVTDLANYRRSRLDP